MPPRPRKSRREREPYEMLQDLKQALWHLKEARALLRRCGCRSSTLDNVRKVYKSIEGSIRFMQQLNEREKQSKLRHRS